MKKDSFKKYIMLITYAMILGIVMLNFREILSFLGQAIAILSPLWIGIALAFTLNVPMTIIEKEIFGKTDKKIRIVSIILSILIIVLLLLILFVWVIPDFIDSITYLLAQIPNLLNSLNAFLLDAFKNTELSDYLANFTSNTEFTSIISEIFKSLINNLSGTLSNLATLVVNLFTGIIIAVYFLFEKEHILGELKRLIDNLLDKKIVKKVNDVLTLSNKSFHDFITYQCLECLILGALMFVAFVIFRFPYALTIAFLTTVTAIVPIFGATLACIVGAILIGTVSIKQAIVFVIVYQVIQQIEGNLIYPKVVGKHVGLPPVITIIAIIIGGKVAGFFGMLICIPITSILYSLFWTKIKEKEKAKKLEVETN